MKRAALVLAGLLSSLPAAAQDAEGCKDHPLFTRIKGYALTACETKFDAADILVSEEPDSPRNLHPEGDKTYLAYSFAEEGRTAPSYLQIRRNYQNAAKTLGAKVLADRSTYTAFLIQRTGGTVYASVAMFNDGRDFQVTVLEQKAMVQEVSADTMWEALQQDGYIALDIHFDTAKAVIKPESQPIVAQIVALLRAQPGLRVSVDGHTDNQGAPAANKALSLARAKAVADALQAAGIAATRLQAQGFGQELPVADNRKEAGRALNRRVEIVKR